MKCISKVLPFDSEESNRPERNSDKIAWVSLQLSADGKYIENSLSISPIIWAMNQIKISKGKISDVLDGKLYKEDTEGIEKKFFCQKDSQVVEREQNGDESSKISENDKSEEEKMQTFVAEAVNLKKLQMLFKEIEKYYIKENIENSDSEIDAYEEVYGISFQLFKDQATKNRREEDNYLGLNCNYYSDDIKLVLDKVKSGKLEKDSDMGKDLLRYITILNQDLSNCRKINVVDPSIQGKEKYLQQINELLSVANAPLGKWPSRFMPAFMQQIAINLAIGKGNSKLFGVNGKVFSVNGPPGTGKTTMLKEIVVNNVVERARLLSKYDNPEDAFEECNFWHGDKENSAYSTYTRHWYRLKDNAINDYSMLVTSCNNAAVENISKELPKEMLKDLNPLDEDSEGLRAMLLEVANLFNAKESGVIEITQNEESYPDLYFTKYAQDLLERKDVWGMIAAPLGKKTNLSNFYYKVLYPLSRDFYKNKYTARERGKKYKEAKKLFEKQLKKVEDMRNTLRKLGDLSARKMSAYDIMVLAQKEYQVAETSWEVQSKEANSVLNELRTCRINLESKHTSCTNVFTQLQSEFQIKESELHEENLLIKQSLEKELRTRNSVSVFAKLFKSEKYKAAMKLADEYKRDAQGHKSREDQ